MIQMNASKVQLVYQLLLFSILRNICLPGKRVAIPARSAMTSFWLAD